MCLVLGNLVGFSIHPQLTFILASLANGSRLIIMKKNAGSLFDTLQRRANLGHDFFCCLEETGRCFQESHPSVRMAPPPLTLPLTKNPCLC